MRLHAPPRARRAAVRCAVAFAALVACSPAPARLVVMHGYADVTSALVWIQADAPGPVVVSWRTAASDAAQRLELDARAADDNVVVARLTGLVPGERSDYTIVAGGETHAGTVRAQPWWRQATAARDITIALGSCFFLADADRRWPGQDYGDGYGIFAAIAARKPDLMLWLGDNLYYQRPDFLDPASLAARHRRQRGFEPLQELLTAAPQLAIWDDHDYGPNDSDASYVLKGETLKLFRRYWPNPSFGLPDVPGVFGHVLWGDVHLFLLDDRYHRSPDKWPEGADKTMFGARQLEWLKQALTYAPRTALKIFAGGNQFWNRANRFEGWNRYATEQKAFAQWLLAQRIEGVVFVSGDRHFGELLKIERPGAYPLYEFTSSPLTSRPPARIDGAERDNPDLVPGTLAVKRQFGIIEVKGAGTARQVAFAAYDGEGALLWRHEVALAELRFPAAREDR